MVGLIQLVLFLFPAASIVLGFLGFFAFKDLWVMPLIVALVSITLMFTVFNTTFFMWVWIYTILTFSSGLAAKAIRLLFGR
ncbi:DUF2651 family protein [Halobacillus mangrovi]|uniref:DUF2651 domain-containing protein n=1 Tax=Halobacillus mangrovi TaxID=402384 RepID=A0A1W5ZYP0_9BACI|nr:DUF2651 family protein [Halobacillus mangrovi]ARI78448.1 hypothetical protein HM131_17100 [Halobacillus mangrovi]